ncbi:hypothetical protein OG21DRAFT_925458 [Imleria badia]|nr:hypothetical protein OG21DRAFT_925458 [Imleria badia]
MVARTMYNASSHGALQYAKTLNQHEPRCRHEHPTHLISGVFFPFTIDSVSTKSDSIVSGRSNGTITHTLDLLPPSFKITTLIIMKTRPKLNRRRTLDFYLEPLAK